jgi:NAD(P)-dependent dehydrogenase (short-subunit alcohol dehydrogenase family)
MSEARAALVTGSTSGIGLAIATAFARAGMNVMLNGLGDADDIERTRAALEAETGAQVRFDGANLLEPEGCAELVANTEAAFGKLDVLVHGTRRGPKGTTSRELPVGGRQSSPTRPFAMAWARIPKRNTTPIN